MTAEENDIDCLFELCKEDFPFLSSEQQTINIGKFLHVSQIKEYQIRILSNIMPGLGEGWYQKNRQETGQVHGCSTEDSGGGRNKGAVS